MSREKKERERGEARQREAREEKSRYRRAVQDDERRELIWILIWPPSEPLVADVLARTIAAAPTQPETEKTQRKKRDKEESDEVP